MKVTNILTTKFINVELLGFIDDTIANRKSYIQLVNGEFKFIGGTGINTDFLFYNKLTDGPILIINSTGIDINGEVDATTIKGNISQNLIAGDGITLSTTSGITKIEAIPLPDPLSVNQLNCDIIDSRLYLFSDSSNYDDKSRIYRQGNILKIAGGEVAGDENASIFFYTGPPTGTPQLKIDKNNNKVTIPDFVANDIYSLRGTIDTFNSNSVTSAFVGSDEIETKKFTINDETTSNASYFERVDDKFRFVGSDGVTPVDWEFYKTDGINPLMKIQAGNDRVIIDGTLQANIAASIKAGTGISFTTNPLTGVTEITNTASVEDPLTINTLNSTTINNTSTITTDKISTKYIDIIDINNSNISTFSKTNNILNLFGTSTSTPININFFTKLYTSNMPILQLLGTDNKAVINGLLEADTITADISNNLVAGDGIQLDTTAGITTITNTGLVVSPLTIDTINSTTINNSGLITTDDMTVNGTLFAPYIEGFTQSTEYGFKAFSNSDNSNITVGGKIAFNTVTTTPTANVFGYCVPNITDYSTAQARYTIPAGAGGLWAIGCKVKVNSAPTVSVRLAIYKNGVNYNNGGAYAANSEGIFMTDDCVAGDYYEIFVISGTMVIDLRPGGSYWYGFKLQPANNLITTTTDLNVKNLTTTNNINGATITGDVLVGLAGINSITDISANGVVYGNTGNFSSSVITSDLTVNTSITGAANINITGNITAGIIQGNTLTGNISGNLQASTGIDLSTAAGITTITNTAPYQLPVSRVYARINQINEAPLSTSLFYYTTFDTLTLDCPNVSFTPPNINTGGVNAGFIINTQGTYKITYTQCVHSISYTNRVNWWTRLLKNGTPQFCATFIYTRSDNSQYGQYGSGCTSQILVLEVGDYLQLQTRVAKNSPAFNNNFSGLEGYSGSSFIIELLS